MQEDTHLLKRIKSFAWRIGMMTLAFFLTITADNIGMLELNPAFSILLGLVLGEVSKAINTELSK